MLYKILFVDDETPNLRLMERLFGDRYEVYTASSAEEAIEILQFHDVALIISDQRMPMMTGLEFLKRAAGMRPHTVRIILTGYTDANDLVDALNSGVIYKYITKPWVNEELQQTVKRALQHYESMRGQRQLQARCERLQARLISSREGFIGLILRMLDLKIDRCSEHVQRTAALCVRIAECLGMSWEDRDVLSLAARLQDVVLFCSGESPRPASVTQAETAGKHIDVGLQIVEKVPDLEEVAALLRFRYERFDGTGHPHGFVAEQIPLGARILAAADTYDKLRYPDGRGDDSGMSHEDAMRVIEFESGSRYDPHVIRVMSDMGEIWLGRVFDERLLAA